MDSTVKESVALLVELVCAIAVMALLSCDVYENAIIGFLQRLF